MSSRNKKYLMLAAVVCVLMGTLLVYFQQRSHRLTYTEFESLINGPEGSGATMWEGVHYCGQEDGLAYFCNRLAWQKTFIAISSEKTKGFPVFNYTRDSDRWLDASRSVFHENHVEYSAHPSK